MRLYFDNAASTPMFPEVIDVISKSMQDHFGNPSSIHSHGRKARASVEQARKVIAYHLGCSVSEIIFTSGGSEANNTAIKGAINDLDIDNVITTKIEHPCVLRALEHLAGYKNFKLHYLNVDQNGIADPAELEQLLASGQQKTLVSIMHANNEIGSMNDVEKIGLICEKYNAIFHSDTVQTVGHFPINFSKSAMAMASASAHKFHGPKGIGILYLNQKYHKIKPLIDGGGQERNMRAGTENVASIIGMAKALELYCTKMEAFKIQTIKVRDYAMDEIVRNFPEAKINGALPLHALYTVLSVTFPQSKRSELLIFNLDIEGISASGGSACSSGVQKISHVLATISPNDTGTTVRFSFSPFNQLSEVDFMIEKLIKILRN